MSDVIKFWTENFEDDLEMKNLLMRRIVSEFMNKCYVSDFKNKQCDNCKKQENDCLDGKPLVKGWKGLKVRASTEVYSAQNWYYVPIQTKGVVQEFHDTVVSKYCATSYDYFNMTFSVNWDCPEEMNQLYHDDTTGIVYDCKE